MEHALFDPLVEQMRRDLENPSAQMGHLVISRDEYVAQGGKPRRRHNGRV